MKIHVIAYFNEIFFVLKEYYFCQFKTEWDNIDNIFAITHNRIIIIEPFRIDDKYFTISPIYKRYLSIHSPDTKLIVMGFQNIQSSNYIDLLNLPKDFNGYVENALPVSEEWESPIDGADMLEYLKRFFEGHGGDSLLSKLNQLKQSVNIAQTQIVNKEAAFQEIWDELFLPYAKPEWQELINRWQNYYPYFEYLPFYPTMQKIDQRFSEISEIFTCAKPSEKLFLKLDIDTALTHIHQQLTEIDRLYIRPEIYKEQGE